MKIKFTILFFFFGIITIVKAQDINTSFNNKMKEITKELDSTKFKNNILYDRAYPLAQLKTFNQNQRKDTSNVTHFFQAIHELYLASNENKYLTNFEKLKQIEYNENYKNKIGIGIINYDITMLKSESFGSANPLMRIDSSNVQKKYYEIPNKNPYQNSQCLVISPLEQVVEEDDKPLVFSFENSFFQESSNPIQNLYVDFGEGQNQKIISNGVMELSEVSINFRNTGKLIFKYFGNYQNGLGFETYSSITHKIKTTRPLDEIGCESNIIGLRADEGFTPYVYDSPYISPEAFQITRFENAEIEYKIFYSGSNCVLRKPIVILDGIDFDGSRDIDFIYKNVLIQDNDTTKKVGNKLRKLGYDVVIVNFPRYAVGSYKGHQLNPHEPEYVGNEIHYVFRDGGADYIQRNAKAVKKLIKLLNSTLIANNSTNKLVVVGPSMGGLVSRWALKELENEGYNHNTRLWVSFDAPHQGANIPLGLQFFAQYAANAGFLYRLNRPASKQILVHHYSFGSPVSGGATGFRSRFQNELQNLGYPIINIRKIALVNGSANGLRNYTPGQEIANIHVWMTSFPYGNAAWGHFNFSNDSGVNQVSTTDTRDGLTWTEITKYVATVSNIGSYDTAPGCKFSLTGDTSIGGYINPSCAPTMFGCINLFGNVEQFVDYFTFMPTKSTLDYQGSNHLLSESFCNRNLVTANQTPFDAYYTPTTNEEHVALNTNNVAWLLNEIKNNPSPQPICSGNRLGFDITYQKDIGVKIKLSDLPNEIPFAFQKITNVNWTLTSGNGQILNSNDVEAEITDANFTGVVTATNENGETFSKNFFWPDPSNCKAIVKIGIDRYHVIDRCQNNAIVSDITEKEIYNVYGNVIDHLGSSSAAIELENGNTGDVQIIHVISEGENLTKIIVKE